MNAAEASDTTLEGLLPALRRISTLLVDIAPSPPEFEHDVRWQGPYFIPRPGCWCPSRFMLYNGELHLWLEVDGLSHTLIWNITEGTVTQRAYSYCVSQTLSPKTWASALAQIEKKLYGARGNFSVYNRRVARQVPLSCRHGKIERRLTWAKNTTPSLNEETLTAFAQVMSNSATARLTSLTLSHYLDTAAIIYDALFDELRDQSPLQKYRHKADGRHGGLLDLKPQDAAGFSAWFESSSRQGAHPWEIIFAQPHGILLCPNQDEPGVHWMYYLAVGSEQLYSAAVKAALALHEAEITFRFVGGDKVLATLRGTDEVEVGPDCCSIHYEDLAAARPDVLPAIRWESLPVLKPATKEQSEKIRRCAKAQP